MHLLLWMLACSDTGFVKIPDPVDGDTDNASACLSATPNPLWLGGVTVDASALGVTSLSGLVTLSNDCAGADLTLLEPTLSSGELALSELETSELAGGESVSVVVTWTPAAAGTLDESLYVQSDGDDSSVVEVDLTGEVSVVPPELLVTPWDQDLGEVEVGTSRDATFEVSNIGDGTLVVESLTLATGSTDEFAMSLGEALPWTLATGGDDAVEVTVTYQPTDAGEDAAELQFVTNHPEEPEDQAVVDAIGVEGEPLGCWYTYDRGVLDPVGTDSAYPIDEHGGLELYYYEPSGGNGLVAPGDEANDFATLRDYIYDNHTDYSTWSTEAELWSTSTVAFGTNAHFTYFLCDWTADDDVSEWTLQTGPLDDGMLVLLNQEVVTWEGYDVSISEALDVVPGARNTLVLIHVDDAEFYRGLTDLGLYADGALFGGDD